MDLFPLNEELATFDWANPGSSTVRVLAARARRLSAIRRDGEGTTLALMLKTYSSTGAAGVVQFVRDWAMTIDPRREGNPVLPFVMFPLQEEFLVWLHEGVEIGKDGLADKSRDMGVTWLCSYYALWRWLFRSGSKVGFGSRKQDLVDRTGDPDCIFEKLRFALRCLPSEFTPPGFNWDHHSGLMKLVNPHNGAAITGEAGSNIGRGGRSSVYFLDEAAFIEHPDLVEAALSQNTNCRVYVSTPNGMGNPFFRKRHSGLVRTFTLHWSGDPRKSKTWALEQQSRLEAHIYAQEVEIDYTASVEGLAIEAKWVRSALELGATKPKSSGRVIAALDVAAGGKNKSVYVAVAWPNVLRVRSANIEDSADVAAWGVALALEDKARLLNYDATGVGVGVASHLRRTEGLSFPCFGVQSGEAPTDAMWDDGRTSQEKFLNLRAELWWLLRERFRKTHEHMTGTAQYPLHELVALPPLTDEGVADLVSELSTVKAEQTNNGKTKIESKADMRRRGVASPDHADALVYTGADMVELPLDGGLAEADGRSPSKDWSEDDEDEYDGGGYSGTVDDIGRELDAVHVW